LRKVLKTIPPFKCKLQKFGYFKHQRSCSLFLEPEFDPPNALTLLLQKISNLFPQCNDQESKSNTGKYIAHMTVASFRSMEKMIQVKERLEEMWVPIEFVVKEIYLLNRKGGDIFLVKHSISLGRKKFAPSFGRRSLMSKPNESSREARTIMVCGIPDTVKTNRELLNIFKNDGFNPMAAEILQNPKNKLRDCGMVEFETRENLDQVIANFTSNIEYPSMYIYPLYMMVFGDVINGTCSYEQVSNLIKIQH